MSGLARAVAWTQRIGYSYPDEIFVAALKATHKKLSALEVEHCVNEHHVAQVEWRQRVELWQSRTSFDEARERL